MDLRLRDALAALPPLDETKAQNGGAPCKICGSPTGFFDVSDFNKCASPPPQDCYQFGPAGIPVSWYRCETCCFVFTTFFDDWVPEDFAAFIYNDDYVKFDGEYLGVRPERTAAAVAQLLRGHEAERILDYGSGAGIFAQRMAQHGFSRVENYDPFASPARPAGRFNVITCFEVVEHTPDPMRTFADIAAFLAPGGTVIMSTGVQPADFETLRANWWYAAPRNGHVSLYSDAALTVLAARAGLRFHPGGLLGFTSTAKGPLVTLTEQRIGPPLFFANLGAPPFGRVPGWHTIEATPRGSFRWTAEPSVPWRVDLPEGRWRLKVRIPVWGQVADGAWTLTMNGLPAALHREGRAWSAECDALLTGRVAVVLTTAAIRSPHEMTGSPDTRRLGLAIPVLDGAAAVPVGRHAAA